VLKQDTNEESMGFSHNGQHLAAHSYKLTATPVDEVGAGLDGNVVDGRPYLEIIVGYADILWRR
jgi:hypothetical protein